MLRFKNVVIWIAPHLSDFRKVTESELYEALALRRGRSFDGIYLSAHCRIKYSDISNHITILDSVSGARSSNQSRKRSKKQNVGLCRVGSGEEGKTENGKKST